ncbi:DNA damage-inducible transcript 3 protein [Patagioenas fasciata]|uniref:DNA damage-inducible transcript 3 protein n=1 Tax=Patagioenas fasciata monilis TaxID=372326 RepID=A0A1V4L0T1_PATFA|nr:DNA damage-inducible transcript 3 protein [Patagioenas fasciata monilis]
MAAEGLSAGGSTSALPAWDLEAWYQDLEEVLAAAEPSGSSAPWGAEQAELVQLWGTEGAGPEGCELDAALATELLEPASTAGAEPAGPPGSASPPQLGSEDEAGAAAGRGVKRKRCSAGVANKELAKRQERANEQRVLELMAHNERLRQEIRRLSAEVERTRAALIERIVNLRRA